jgi:hypothetical protein
MPKYRVEFDEVVDGIRIVGIMIDMGHRCGYAMVPQGNPFCGVSYSTSDRKLSEILASFWQERKYDPNRTATIPMVLSAIKGFPRVDFMFDVHGGLTFSSYEGEYPVKFSYEDGTLPFWYGFDCAHSSDRSHPKNTEYVRDECRKLARQINEFGKAVLDAGYTIQHCEEEDDQ